MKYGTKIFLILMTVIPCSFFASSSVFATDTPLGKVIGIGPWQIIPDNAGVAFSNLASTILGFLTALGGLASFLYLVMGALSWITSGGDKAGMEKAKGQITNAMIGLVIIVASWSIVFLIGGILGLDIVNPQNLIPKLDPKYQAPAQQIQNCTSLGAGYQYDTATQRCVRTIMN